MALPSSLDTPLLDKLTTIVRGKTLLVLSGAGISTDSGIPDYRGEDRRKTKRTPLLYQTFVSQEKAQQHYWARSVIGWPHIERAQPNNSHYILAELEARGKVTGIITQNVDGLHSKAGNKKVIELHGSLAWVRCLNCKRLESRKHLQERLLDLNPDFSADAQELAPDGDAELDAKATASFYIPACLHCGGTLKPDVVFFGENVPKKKVLLAWDYLDKAELLLVLGSSLTVFSGYRFVARAVSQKKPVIIINKGKTRGDDDATLKLDTALAETLPALQTEL